MSTHPHVDRKYVLVTGMALSLTAALAACGGGSNKAATSSASTTVAATRGGFGARSVPGTSGLVASVSGTSMEVQNPTSGQETVNWTASTRFSKTATLTVSSLSAGSCVTVIGTTSGLTVTARSVAVSQPSSSGTCTRGGALFGRTGRRGGSPSGSTPSRSFPAGGGSGFAGALANAAIVTGKLVSVGPTSMVVDGIKLSGSDFRSAASTSSPPTTAAPSQLTVAVSSSTTVTETESTTASSLAVGDCVTANGPSNSTGAITATSIRITSTGSQSCTSGFGGGFFGGAGGGAA